AHVGGDRAAEVAGPEDRAEDGGARDEVQRQADELEDADGDDGALGVAELHRALDGGGGAEDLHRGVEEKERDSEPAHGGAGPERRRRRTGKEGGGVGGG